MAPELLRGGAADVRSDIYSLGQTFACLLTGQVQAGNSEPIPSKLKPILARMTAGLPEQRYQTADELIRALDAATKSSYIKFWMAAILAVILSTLGFMLLPSTKVPVVEPPQPPATTVTETKTKTPVKSSPVADWKTELHQNDFLPPPFDITSPTGWDGFFEAVVNCYYANRDDHAFGVMFTPFRSLHQMGRGSDAERLVALQLSRPLSGNAIKQAEKRIGDLAIAANWEDTLGNKEKSEEYHARIQELIAAETSDLNRDRLNLYYEGRKKVRWRQFTVPKELVEAIDEGESSVKDLCDQGRYQDAIRRYLTAVHDSSVARDPEVRLLYNGYGESYVLSRMIEKGDLDGAEKLRREVDCAESMYFRMGCFLTLGYLKTGRKDEAQAAWNASIEKLTRRMNQQPSLVEKFEFLNTLLESVADTGLYEYVRTESRK